MIKYIKYKKQHLSEQIIKTKDVKLKQALKEQLDSYPNLSSVI